MAKKEKSPEQQLKELCQEIKLEIDRWNNLKIQGGNDPFWDYMAKPKQIEKDARESLAKYKAEENYQWLLRCNTSTNVKKKTCYEAVMGYVSGLEEAIKIGDLVAMRRHRNPEVYLGSFAECRKRIEEAMAEETLDGQMELFDFI